MIYFNFKLISLMFILFLYFWEKVIFACLGLKWFLNETVLSKDKDYRNYDSSFRFMEYVLAAIILDILLAGSEIVHKLRLVWSEYLFPSSHRELYLYLSFLHE